MAESCWLDLLPVARQAKSRYKTLPLQREVENKIHNLLSDRNMDAITASATDAHSSSLRADLEAAEHDLNDKAVALNAAETAAERAEAAEGSCKARLADIRQALPAL